MENAGNEFVQKGLVTSHSPDMLKYGMYSLGAGAFVLALFFLYAILESYDVYEPNTHIISYFNIVFGVILVMTFLALSKSIKDNSSDITTTMFMAIVIFIVVLGLLFGCL